MENSCVLGETTLRQLSRKVRLLANERRTPEVPPKDRGEKDSLEIFQQYFNYGFVGRHKIVELKLGWVDPADLFVLIDFELS